MKCTQVQWRDDPDALQRWKDGRTGLPLVDANMREMAQTGAQRTNDTTCLLFTDKILEVVSTGG